MSIFFWNTRGLNKKERRADLKEQLAKWLPSLVGLVETKVKESKAFRVIKCFPNHWIAFNNYNHSPRWRIWVGWDPHIWKCNIISSSSQQITAACTNAGGLFIYISIIYGANYQSQRVSLWMELIHLSGITENSPWAVIGDFNTSRYSTEKVGGRFLNMKQLKDFNDCIDSCKLSDVRSNGGLWTWHNNSLGTRRITGRIDRMMGNPIWIDQLLTSHYDYLSASTSDHSPMLLHIVTSVASHPKPFRYINYWSNCEGYQDIFKNAWSPTTDGNPIFKVIQKLKNTKLAFKSWCKLGYSSPKNNILTIRESLIAIQRSLVINPLDEDLHMKETKLKNDLELWLGMEENQLRQKSREL